MLRVDVQEGEPASVAAEQRAKREPSGQRDDGRLDLPRDPERRARLSRRREA